MEFLRDPAHKAEMFDFLTAKVKAYKWTAGRAIYINSGSLPIINQVIAIVVIIVYFAL